MQAREIRPYGKGKFDTILDSYIYELVCDLKLDDEIFFDGGGWLGLVEGSPEFIAAVVQISHEIGNPLTKQEIKMLSTIKNGGMLLFQGTDGVVEISYYSNINSLKKHWHEIRKELKVA